MYAQGDALGMRKPWLLLALAAPLALAGPRQTSTGALDALNGIPIYLGTIDATTTSKTNHQATTPFNNTGSALCGKVLLIQNAGAIDIRIHPVTTNTDTVSNSRGTGFGPAISPGERVIVFMPTGSRCWVAGITTSSTANIDFWELQ